jgi:hypothetical protein
MIIEESKPTLASQQLDCELGLTTNECLASFSSPTHLALPRGLSINQCASPACTT